jgi:hypothetical protein
MRKVPTAYQITSLKNIQPRATMPSLPQSPSNSFLSHDDHKLAAAAREAELTCQPGQPATRSEYTLAHLEYAISDQDRNMALLSSPRHYWLILYYNYNKISNQR